MSKNSMTQAAAARIQSAQAKANGGTVTKDSFAARAQSAANKPSTPRPRPANAPSTTRNKSGGNRGNNPPKSK